MSNKNELILNIHILKTAGTTLRDLLDKEYGYDKSVLIMLNKWKHNNRSLLRHIRHHAKSCKVISGHFGYNLWSPITKYSVLKHLKIHRPISYITMLRNPVDRKISEYFFLKKLFRNKNTGITKLTLEEYVNSNIRKNLQTNAISSGADNLNIAKRNLTKFKVVGITERFKESVLLLKKEFNWTSPAEYTYINANKNRPSLQDIPPKIIKDIKRNNQLDMQLYRFALELFEKRLRDL